MPALHSLSNVADETSFFAYSASPQVGSLLQRASEWHCTERRATSNGISITLHRRLCAHVLTSPEDETVHEKTLAGLRAAGFRVESDRLVPPDGAQSTDVIAAIINAFQRAKGKK